MFVQWAANSPSAFVQNMGINHGGADILVPQQLLNCANNLSIECGTWLYQAALPVAFPLYLPDFFSS
jgi:hypothetical protein